MDEQDLESAADAQKKAWTYYAASALGLTSSLAIAALLFGTFWMSRPYNFEHQTRELANLLEVALVDLYIPQKDIKPGKVLTQGQPPENPTTFWTLHPIEVSVPKRLNREGLLKNLHKAMNAYDVRMVNENPSPTATNTDQFAFYLGEYKFALLTLVPSVEEALAINRSDLRSSSVQLADLTHKILESHDSESPPTREPTIPKEDLNSLWNYTLFTATLPPGLSLGALKEELEAAIALPDAQVEVGKLLAGHATIRITLGGRPCVEVACLVTPSVPPARPEPVNLDRALAEGIQGSTPMEVTAEEEISSPMKTPPKAPEDTMVVTPVAAPTPPTVVTPPAAAREKEKPATTRLAIIIDDGGYVRADSDRILKLDPRLTLAILPNTPHGKDTAREGAALGFEIMLHMPMETHSESEQAVEGTLFTAMGKKEIQKLTRSALEQYPEVTGLNNHTGSKFTEKAKKLGFVFEVLKERGLFFIDSYTKNTSVALETAQKAGIPTARRDVFLDNDKDAASIRAQFEELVRRAIQQGSAIGIGHFQKPNTAKVLAEEIPKLKNAGIELVHASELVQ